MILARRYSFGVLETSFMQTFLFFLYNTFVVPLIWMVFRLGALFNDKIRRGVEGRRDLFRHLQSFESGSLIDFGESRRSRKSNSQRIWFHASSLGEFEQAKPIIVELKRRHPEVEIIVTFFSPSGYEHSRNYKLATIISYIPFDSYWNAKRFVEIIRPDAAVIMRYDLWPNHIWRLAKENIPIFLVNATMQQDILRRFSIVKSFYKSVYASLNSIFAVSDNDAHAFAAFQIASPKIEVIGDTRYDQVWLRSKEARTKHLLPNRVVKGKKVFVVGSSWESDEEVLLPAFFRLQEKEKNLLMILVPHEPTLENLERIETELNGNTSFIRFSDLNDYNAEQVIVVNSVGILLSLYTFASVAYVGGSFKQGVHNVLEPAVFGIPVLYGPRHENSHEAIDLAERGGGIVVKNEEELYRHLQTLLRNEKLRNETGKRALALVKKNIGATERFLSSLEKIL